MAIDVFSVVTLNRLLRETRPPNSYLAQTYFPLVQRDGAEDIAFEVVNDRARLTPFVSPLVAGQVVDSLGSEVKSFRPAYVKDLRRFNPHLPLRRMIGEGMGGTMSPEQRRLARLNIEMADQLDMLSRRWTVMISELLRTSAVTVTGEKYPTKVVNFGRNAGHTIALTSTARWGESGVEPIDDLEAWVDLILTNSGFVSRRITMDPKAWQLFTTSTKLGKQLETRRNTNVSITLDPTIQGQQTITDESRSVNARYRGAWGDLEFWVYQEKYLDENGVEQKVLPDYTVLIGGEGAQGTRAYGAIHDEGTGYTADDYYVKSWVDHDPPVRWLLLQAAPLPVLYRPNATLCATVHDGA